MKTVRVFFIEDNGLGEKSVAGAVAGRIALPLFGDGAAGKGSVGSGCLNLFISWHNTFSGHRLTPMNTDAAQVLLQVIEG